MTEDNPTPTYVTDNFPLGKLECQYHLVCGEYLEGDCSFDIACPVRWMLRDFLDDVVVLEDLRFQIENILDRQNI